MKPIQALLTGTAVVALLAGPAAALDVGGRGDVILSLDTTMAGTATGIDETGTLRDNAGAERDSSLLQDDEAPLTPGVTEPQVQAQIADGTERGDSMTASDNVEVVAPPDVDSGFAGDVVYSADSAILGVITSAGNNGDGTQKLVMALDEGVEAGTAQEVSFTVGGGAQSDGEIRMAWTKAEFESQLDGLVRPASDEKS